MSVLKSLKGTIQSVQQDISSSFKSLTTTKEKNSQQKNPKNARLQSHHSSDLDAGADLLHRNQENWRELHIQAEENATNAENLAVVIGSLFVTLDKQAESMAQVCEEVKVLPSIIQQLQELTNHIAGVEELCEQVEAAAVQLENLCDIQDFQKSKLDHCYQLATYKDKKKSELEKFKVQLAQQHAKKVKAKEIKKKTQLKERQSIFQEAFDKDVNYYRTFGRTERQPSVESNHDPVDLSEVSIEEDADALDDFLASAEATPSGDRPLVFARDVQPEEESDSGVMNDREESPDTEQSSPSLDQATQGSGETKESEENSKPENSNGDTGEAVQQISVEKDDSCKQGDDEGGGTEQIENSSDSTLNIMSDKRSDGVNEENARISDNTDDIQKTCLKDIEESSDGDSPCLANEIALVDELMRAGDAAHTAAEPILQPATQTATQTADGGETQ